MTELHYWKMLYMPYLGMNFAMDKFDNFQVIGIQSHVHMKKISFNKTFVNLEEILSLVWF